MEVFETTRGNKVWVDGTCIRIQAYGGDVTHDLREKILRHVELSVTGGGEFFVRVWLVNRVTADMQSSNCGRFASAVMAKHLAGHILQAHVRALEERSKAANHIVSSGDFDPDVGADEADMLDTMNKLATQMPWRLCDTGQEPIGPFRDGWRWLSNFWLAPVPYEGESYPSTEHAYQAAKTLDLGKRDMIRNLQTPGNAKRFLRGHTIRGDWDEIKLDVMRELTRAKFGLHFDLRQRLLATGERPIIEYNTWGDTFWGVCKGEGENHLGRIIMEVRRELQGLERAPEF